MPAVMYGGKQYFLYTEPQKNALYADLVALHTFEGNKAMGWVNSQTFVRKGSINSHPWLRGWVSQPSVDPNSWLRKIAGADWQKYLGGAYLTADQQAYIDKHLSSAQAGGRINGDGLTGGSVLWSILGGGTVVGGGDDLPEDCPLGYYKTAEGICVEYEYEDGYEGQGAGVPSWLWLAGAGLGLGLLVWKGKKR